ncbi:MAG TPA: hypothetical protein VJM11_15675 [Nevskiaceae bacterium]|nr:hypothetical protein [Nevskiaceae bacterium]
MAGTIRNALLAGVLASIAGGAAAQNLIGEPRAQNPTPDPRSRRSDVPDDRQYQYGKEVYAVKLGCETCPLGTAPLDEKIAKRFLYEDMSLWDTLSPKEADAVVVYLKQLYNLR